MIDDYDDFDEEDDDCDDPAVKKAKRKIRFSNKFKRDKIENDRQPWREKVKSKIYRPKFTYDPEYYGDDWEDEWDGFDML